MWSQFLIWMGDNRVGDLASLLGVLISVIGFAVTMHGIRKSKTAAEGATLAAQAARDSLTRFESVVDFTAAISTLEEIKRAHRRRDWQLLPDRYSSIRKTLIVLRTSQVHASDFQRTVIQQALQNLSTVEKAVEAGLQDPDKLKPARMNALISNDTDNLMTVLTQLKRAV